MVCGIKFVIAIRSCREIELHYIFQVKNFTHCSELTDSIDNGYNGVHSVLRRRN